MNTAVFIIHFLACIGLILVVLLQTGKGASMGAAFGGSSQTVFGSSGATSFLAKMTTGVAIMFMLTSLGLAFVFNKTAGLDSVMQDVTPPPAQSAPAQPKPAQPEPAKQAPAEQAPKTN